jgi:hypothetical protein
VRGAARAVWPRSAGRCHSFQAGLSRPSRGRVKHTLAPPPERGSAQI